MGESNCITFYKLYCGITYILIFQLYSLFECGLMLVNAIANMRKYNWYIIGTTVSLDLTLPTTDGAPLIVYAQTESN